MRITRAHRFIALGAVLLAAACGSSDNGKKASKGPQAFVVRADANDPTLGLPATEFVLGYYPKAVSVHPGDTVSFGLNDSGEPHTVAMGSLIEAVAIPYSKLTPAQKHADKQSPALEAAFKKIPQLLPQGPGDAIQAGAQPCFQATGLPSTKAACAVKTGDFTGGEALVTSGWLDPNAPFTLKISDTAKAGTYDFFCQLHGPDMAGTLTVVDKATDVKTPDQVAQEATTELQADTGKLAAAAASLTTGTAAHAFAGVGSKDFEQGGVAAFGPATITIPVGGTVHWFIQGPHSVFFNAPADAQQLRVPAPDGSVHLNVKAVSPVGGPGQSDKPGPINGGVWNGVGPHSSGIVFGEEKPAEYTLTFSTTGTFTYICSIHLNMKGTVTVG